MMKKAGARAVITAVFVLLIALFFASCDLLTGLMNLSGDTTTSTTIRDEPLTSYKPVLTLSTSADAKAAKVVTNVTLTNADYNFALGCPALSGFSDGGTALSEASTFDITYLGVAVTFTVHYFEDGTADRIVKGVRYTGLSADNSIVLLIEYDPAAKAFYYEEKIFIDDPLGKVFNKAGARSLIYYTMKGTIAPNNSIIAKPQGAAFNVPPSGGMFASFKRMEYYSGPWDFAGTKKGTGIALKDCSCTMYASMPAAAGGYTKPLENFGVGDLPNAMGYIAALLEETTPSYISQYQLLYKVEGEPSFASVTDYLNGFRWNDLVVAPTTAANARSRLPSEVWKSITTL